MSLANLHFMSIKAIMVAIILLVGIAEFSSCHAALAGTSNWRVIWFPPNDTLPSWNWVKIGGDNPNAIKIFPANYLQKFPDEVKKWVLGVTSINDPSQRATIPLETPHWGNRLDFSDWMPGEGDLTETKMAPLEAMGEGTFLCAILGDGKRYSNVAKVTIRHSYDVSREPVIRLIAVQPYGKDDPIKYIGAWLVAPTSCDVHFTTTAVHCPVWEVNGRWRMEPGNPSGFVFPLPCGISWGEVYYVGYAADHPGSGTEATLSGSGKFEPPIEPSLMPKYVSGFPIDSTGTMEFL